MCVLKLAGVVRESIVDGPGFRYVIFTQGCPHHCKGCHNPQTHSFDDGYEADIDEIIAEIKKNPLLKGITLSGGEPFCQAEALVPLVKRVREMGKDVFAFSGYTIEQLIEIGKTKPAVKELLLMCDTLVDGPFILEKRDIELQFRGSSNQRVINIKEYFKNEA